MHLAREGVARLRIVFTACMEVCCIELFMHYKYNVLWFVDVCKCFCKLLLNEFQGALDPGTAPKQALAKGL